MDYLGKIVIAFETRDVGEIRECFEHGIDPNQVHKGKPLIYELINMYSRGHFFKECIKAFVDYGLEFDDKVLLSVLLDDADSLVELLSDDGEALERKYSFDCAFTPLLEASLLHICAEYNHLSTAEVLLKHGININTKAGCDENGFGGQTPIFHTVNQHANGSMDMLKFLIEREADLALTVKGMIWGKGYPWETFVPSVNPISYAMMGLLKQFQRSEKDIYEVIYLLMKARYGLKYDPVNIPNKYLNS